MNTILTAFILDDELPAVKNIEILLQPHNHIEIVGTSTNSLEAVNNIISTNPDLLFLDIQMPELDGFELVKAIASKVAPYIIFTTAFDQYALKAFDINALDYLLKPFDTHRFNQSIKKAKGLKDKDDFYGRINQLLATMDKQNNLEYLKKISVRLANKITFINVEDINWIEADNQYVKVHSKQGVQLIRNSLSYLEERLAPNEFYRSHRSAIVNIGQIVEITPYFKGDYIIKLANGAKVKLSRTRTADLKKLLPW